MSLIIAEIGQAHEGSLGILHSYIDALAPTGIDAIKFQTHLAEAESSDKEPFRVKFSYEDKTRFDYWQRMGFTLSQWKEIKAHCDEVGLEFLSSPFSNMAVDWLEEIGVKRYKIGSGEITNFLMLDKIRQTGKEVILSSGMSNYKELDEAVKFVSDNGNKIGVVQCTTAYPTPYNRLGLNVIEELKERYPVARIGLSEHTGKIYACIAAAALGAEIFEFHAVFDRRMFGPDAMSSLTVDEITNMVQGIKSIELAKANPIDKNDLSNYKDLKLIFEKTLAVNRDLKKGHILTFSDLEAKKPANQGISSSEFENVIGKILAIDKKKWDFLNSDDII